MTASNGIRTEYKIKRLAAAAALAIAAMLGVSCLSPARADAAGTSDGNLVIDVPTTVPCALMADGTVVSPSEWKITTSGDAYIASASASGFPANVEWSARTTDLAAAQAGSVEVAGAGDAASVAGPSDPAAAKLAPSAGFEWSFSKLDAGKNSDIIAKAAGGTAVLGSVTFTFAKAVPDAFAVYSADDNSLSFYKRADVPVAGQTFEGKTATEIYEGIEKASYTAADGVPWSGHAADIVSVTVADEGVAPVSTAYWFKGASKLGNVSLAGLDTSQTTCMDGMFEGCSSLETLDLSSMSTRRVASMSAFLGGCDSLAELSLGSEFAWVGEDCYPPTGDWKQESTGTDYAESNIPANKADKYTRTKTAFAVYSADDQSLAFYKRLNVPADGAQFLGKTATKVFTGLESTAGRVPWWSCKSKVKTVTVVDERIAPISTKDWFSYMAALESVDISKMDTSNVTDMTALFYGCKALTSLDLSTFDTRNVRDMSYVFYGCSALTSLDLSSFDTSKVTNMTSLFQDCSALTTLNLSSFDTGNVTDMTRLFYGCHSLTSLDLSSFDTSNVTDMTSLFSGCKALTSLDLSTFDTASATKVPNLFNGCSALTSLDLSSFDTSKVTNMTSLFSGCKALTSLDLSSFGTGNVKTMDYIFRNCSAIQKVAFGADWKWVGTDGYLPTPSSAYIAGADGKWYDTDGIGYVPADIPSNKAMTYTAVAPKKAFAVYSATDGSLSFYNRAEVPKQGSMFLGKRATAVYTGFETKTSIPGWMLNYSSSIKTVTVYDEGIAPISTGHWFAELRNMKTADVTKLDMSKCKTISCMFTDCTSLETLDLSAWDTRSLTSMNQAFQNCTSLTKLNVSGWDVSKVTNMDLVFAEDKALSSLDLSTWNNSAATSMKDAFSMMNSLSEVSLGSKFKFVGTNGYLPTPSSAYIAGADGKWYDTDGNGYAPADIPSSKAMTYTAVAPKSAFAVYSADDDSLSFYKRSSVPTAGDTFEGKTATEVYEGVEKASYTAADGAPWSGHAADIASVTVADEGVAPVSTAYWFKGASKLKSVSLADLDTSQTTCMDGMFDGCSSLESLDLSAMSTRRVASMTAFLGGCDSLAELSIGSEFAWFGDDCFPPTGDWKQGSTGTKYAENQIPANKTDKYTRAKTAFAVYSADDQSLTFYKRPVAPTEGAQFLGKTASKVFTGFETGTYSPSSVPWAAYRSNLKTVTVADEGIAPVSTANWFFSFTNVESINLSKLDTSNVTSIACMFYCCESLTSLDLSSFDTGKVTDMRSVFQDCKSLTSLDLSSFDTGNVTNMICLFTECDSLERISLGTGFKWVGSNCYPRSGNWESSSTGKVYFAREIPSGVADTYVFKPNTKASTAVSAASDPVDNDDAIAAMTSTGNTQGESTTRNDAEGKQPLGETASKESGTSSELDGVEKDAEGKPAVENEATKEDISAIVPEGVEKAATVKSGE